MSAIDPFVADPGEDDLTRKTIRFLAPTLRPTAFSPDASGQNGEIFILALCFEGLVASTAPFEKRLFFPVNPESFGWSNTRTVGAYDLLNAPQATQQGNMQIRTFQIQSFFPQRYEPDFCIPYPRVPPMTVNPVDATVLEYGPPDNRSPQACVTWLTNVMRAGYPLQFTAISLRQQPDIMLGNVKVIISGFNPTYQAGNPLDVFFDLELTELIEPTIIRTSTTTVTTPAKHKDKHYTTRKGDTLVSITRKMYGKKYPNMWAQIKHANFWVYYKKPHPHRHHLGNNKGKLKPLYSFTKLLPGQHLVIPPPKTKKK
jgi:hypothetical protein